MNGSPFLNAPGLRLSSEKFGGLIGIAAQKEGPAVAGPELCRLDFTDFTCQPDGFRAPVELVSLSRLKAERDKASVVRCRNF